MNEELKVIISAEVEKLKQGIANAKSKVKDFQQQVKNASADVDKHFKNIGTTISNAAKTMGTGIAAAAGALLALGASTTEYREQQAQLKSAFEEAGGSAETAKETYNDLYRVLGDTGQAQEAAQHLAKLTTEEKALNEWTTICQGVFATFGASLPIESLTEAANETAKTGELTGALADALNWAGINEDAFTESLAACSTEAEREQLIRETLNGLYADAAATYEANNAQVLAQRDAQAQLQEQLALLGEAVAPIITAFTAFANDALAVVVPYIQQLATEYMPLLQEVLAVVAETLGKVMGFLADNWEIVLTVAAVIGGIAAAIGIYNAVAAVKAAMDAAQVATLGALIAAYAAQAAAMIVAIAPYLLIVAAIAAVIAIIVLCVKHWDEIKAKVKEVWDAITGWISNAAKKVGETVSNMVNSVKNWFSDMGTKISEKAQQIKDTVSEKFNQVKDAVSKATGEAKQVAEKSLTDMKAAYEKHGGGIKGAAAAAMEGVKGVFNTGYTFLNSITGGKLGQLVETAKSKFNAVKSFASNIFENIKNAISDKLEAAKNTVSNVIEKIKGFFKFEWSLPKLKLPSIKITGKFSLSPPEVPKFSINWNALGGVFDKPTLFNYGGSLQGIGEAGAEAVVPLEKNTQWLDKIAERLAAKQANTPIVLTVDGKVFAQTSINTINQLTKQTGSIGLVLA